MQVIQFNKSSYNEIQELREIKTNRHIWIHYVDNYVKCKMGQAQIIIITLVYENKFINKHYLKHNKEGAC